MPEEYVLVRINKLSKEDAWFDQPDLPPTVWMVKGSEYETNDPEYVSLFFKFTPTSKTNVFYKANISRV